jgi:uncharacterized protein (TIGR02588 family)
MLGSGVSFLVYDALARNDESGAVLVRVTDIRATGERHLVKFAVHNRGSETLSQLQLTARLTDGNTEVESAQTFIDYLPARSSRQGGFYLRHDPHRYELDISPAGYVTP